MTTGFRWTQRLGIAVAAVCCACQEGDRATPGAGDTPGMREVLTRDLSAAEADLAALLDSIHVYLGDASTAMLRSASSIRRRCPQMSARSGTGIRPPTTRRQK